MFDIHFLENPHLGIFLHFCYVILPRFKTLAWFFFTNRSPGFWSSQVLTFYSYKDLKCSHNLNSRTCDLEVKKKLLNLCGRAETYPGDQCQGWPHSPTRDTTIPTTWRLRTGASKETLSIPACKQVGSSPLNLFSSRGSFGLLFFCFV
jgi:hypothetical protein